MTLIRFRRDFSDRWAQINPVLKEGEPGHEKDTGRLKIGDGESKWLDLPYIDGENVDDVIQDHINSPTPHPVYDDGPSLVLLYLNAKV